MKGISPRAASAQDRFYRVATSLCSLVFWLIVAGVLVYTPLGLVLLTLLDGHQREVWLGLGVLGLYKGLRRWQQRKGGQDA